MVNAQKQIAEITKQAYWTQQSVKGLALLLGEPSDSKVSAWLDSILALTDDFNVAFAKYQMVSNIRWYTKPWSLWCQ